jgi:ribosomal protein L32
MRSMIPAKTQRQPTVQKLDNDGEMKRPHRFAA